MWQMNHYLPLFLIASCLFFISHSQTISNTTSQHHCLPEQSSTLLQLRQEFVEKRTYPDDYYGVSYPKMKSWKADSDCCSSWDGVTCDAHNGHVIGLDLSNGWLCGPLNSNSSLFSLRHLQKLNLALNNFSSFTTIPSELGQLVRLTHLNLSHSFLHGRIPSEISWLSNLVSLDLSFNYFYNLVAADYKYLKLRRNHLEALVQNMTYLRVLHLDYVNISSSLPQSLANLSSLTSLSLSWCILLGEFPSDIFLLPLMCQSFPELRILVLRANGIHGPIWAPHTGFGFSKLHVIDLSHNNFSGRLPSEYFRTWNAMQMVPAKDKSQPEYMGSQSNYYEDSMTVVNKGLEIFLVKILTIFTAIDLSNNRFEGEIPNSVGNLKGLIVLNLSSNSFMDHVPSSLGNLTALESLDLSQNELSGKIPQQLISLTFLEYLNLSQNQLVGPIPQGGQFWTFENSSFEGNLGLCGSPLSKKCGNNETPTYKTRQESSIVEGFDWKVVVIGYACGLIIGIVIGYFYTSRRTVWFVRNFGVHIRS